MMTNEGFAIYSKILTRTREIELDRLKRENSALRAQIRLAEFYAIYNARYAVQDGKIITKATI